jgi:hypothetical protein
VPMMRAQVGGPSKGLPERSRPRLTTNAQALMALLRHQSRRAVLRRMIRERRRSRTAAESQVSAWFEPHPENDGSRPARQSGSQRTRTEPEGEARQEEGRTGAPPEQRKDHMRSRVGEKSHPAHLSGTANSQQQPPSRTITSAQGVLLNSVDRTVSSPPPGAGRRPRWPFASSTWFCSRWPAATSNRRLVF